MNAKLLNEYYKYAYSLTMQEEDAYDLVQETVSKLIDGRKNRLEEKFYVFRCIKNLFLDTQKKASKRLELADSELDEKFNESDVCFSEIILESQSVKDLLLTLEPNDRELLYLKEFAGFTAEELAVQENKPRGTILNRLFRIKKKLKATLSQRNDHPRSRIRK